MVLGGPVLRPEDRWRYFWPSDATEPDFALAFMAKMSDYINSLVDQEIISDWTGQTMANRIKDNFDGIIADISQLQTNPEVQLGFFDSSAGDLDAHDRPVGAWVYPYGKPQSVIRFEQRMAELQRQYERVPGFNQFPQDIAGKLQNPAAFIEGLGGQLPQLSIDDIIQMVIARVVPEIDMTNFKTYQGGELSQQYDDAVNPAPAVALPSPGDFGDMRNPANRAALVRAHEGEWVQNPDTQQWEKRSLVQGVTDGALFTRSDFGDLTIPSNRAAFQRAVELGQVRTVEDGQVTGILRRGDFGDPQDPANRAAIARAGELGQLPGGAGPALFVEDFGSMKVQANRIALARAVELNQVQGGAEAAFGLDSPFDIWARTKAGTEDLQRMLKNPPMNEALQAVMAEYRAAGIPLPANFMQQVAGTIGTTGARNIVKIQDRVGALPQAIKDIRAGLSGESLARFNRDINSGAFQTKTQARVLVGTTQGNVGAETGEQDKLAAHLQRQLGQVRLRSERSQAAFFAQFFPELLSQSRAALEREEEEVASGIFSVGGGLSPETVDFVEGQGDLIGGFDVGRIFQPGQAERNFIGRIQGDPSLQKQINVKLGGLVEEFGSLATEYLSSLNQPGSTFQSFEGFARSTPALAARFEDRKRQNREKKEQQIRAAQRTKAPSVRNL